MHLAYFPKDPTEASIFIPEFRKHGVDAVQLTPLDILLQGNDSFSAAAAPGLDLKALETPHLPDKRLEAFDIVFQRSVWSWNTQYGPEITDFFFDVLSLIDNATPVVNSASATLDASKKHRCLSRLLRGGLPVVPFFASPSPIRNVLALRNLPPPYAIKTLQGAGGIGVVLAPSASVAGDLISLFHRNRQIPLLQPYLPATYDIRVFTIGGQVVAAIRRKGKIHKHNVALGASAESIPRGELPPESTELAIHAAELLGLQIAGVDLLDTDRAPRLLEVNPSPGFSALAAATSVNIPEKITLHLLKLARK
jgi:ribosomal protein S6--L-glutamate ligase